MRELKGTMLTFSAMITTLIIFIGLIFAVNITGKYFGEKTRRNESDNSAYIFRIRNTPFSIYELIIFILVIIGFYMIGGAFVFGIVFDITYIVGKLKGYNSQCT